MVRDGITVGAFQVRPAAPTDAPAVHKLVTTAPVPSELREEELATQFGGPTRENGRGNWVVDSTDDLTIGYVALASPNDDSAALELSLYLDPTVRCKGLGTELVNAFAKPAAAEGGVSVLTATPHTTAAVKLLKKTGFALRYPPDTPSDPIAAKLETASEVNKIWDCQI